MFFCRTSCLRCTRKTDELCGVNTLYTLPTAYKQNGQEIPIWGGMEVFNSMDAAKKFADVDGRVQLVRVADNAQLKAMLAPGKEFASGGASLYVRVEKTCPAFYARWDDDDELTHHEIWTDVPRGKTKTSASLWQDAEGNLNPRVKFNIYKPTKRSEEGQMVLVRPGTSGVRADSSEVGGSTPLSQSGSAISST